ncbi:hypothetical protein FQZ97_694090 [compost metagenome]
MVVEETRLTAEATGVADGVGHRHVVAVGRLPIVRIGRQHRSGRARAEGVNRQHRAGRGVDGIGLLEQIIGSPQPPRRGIGRRGGGVGRGRRAQRQQGAPSGLVDDVPQLPTEAAARRQRPGPGGGEVEHRPGRAGDPAQGAEFGVRILLGAEVRQVQRVADDGSGVVGGVEVEARAGAHQVEGIGLQAGRQAGDDFEQLEFRHGVTSSRRPTPAGSARRCIGEGRRIR